MSTIITKIVLFQSTLPVRGGTAHRLLLSTGSRNFNPPSPCGEGLPVC